jgi:hypothetical protein
MDECTIRGAGINFLGTNGMNAMSVPHELAATACPDIYEIPHRRDHNKDLAHWLERNLPRIFPLIVLQPSSLTHYRPCQQ